MHKARALTRISPANKLEGDPSQVEAGSAPKRVSLCRDSARIQELQRPIWIGSSRDYAIFTGRFSTQIFVMSLATICVAALLVLREGSLAAYGAAATR
jgi:hypothetical protein